MFEKLSKLTNREAGVLALVMAVIFLPLGLALFFYEWGLVGRAWHWMVSGFGG